MMHPSPPFSRRDLLLRAAAGAAAAALAGCARPSAVEPPAAASPGPPASDLVEATFAFIGRCARDDGGYAPSPDPAYGGYSDTSLSDLAGVTYAAVLAKTLGRELPRRERSIAFVQGHQRTDGSFESRAGETDLKSDLSVLYATVQSAVALRALGARPRIDPARVLDRYFAGGAYRKLPWYTTSFFPLFYAALGRPFPERFDAALAEFQTAAQTDDGYVGDHVAAAFHLAHYFRLVGRAAPRAAAMVARVLRDQKPDGGWNIVEPDWDVHACFDATFILRQLGGDAEPVRRAIAKAADWALSCRNADGGFGHYPGRHSDLDAVYFQLGTLIQAGRVPGARDDIPDAHTLGWGHAMRPGVVYT